ncbi:hypothetical protein [Micromonospora sp. NPDC005324]|uniref:hypothetical protein n=1 Tax=Micromonospora sp. NPDC005324 TaxID=3157033 RepID=UPI00339F1256
MVALRQPVAGELLDPFGQGRRGHPAPVLVDLTGVTLCDSSGLSADDDVRAIG